MEMEECASGVASSLMINRIFIGGLSTSVTAADLEKTFLSLGRVHNMEFVRSNGRSFAFVDFEPNSDKALAKLFAVVSYLLIIRILPFLLVQFDIGTPKLLA